MISNQSTSPTTDTSDFHYFQLWRLLGGLMVGAAFYFSLVPSPPEVLDFAFSDKLEHLFAYSVLMGWFGQLYVSKPRQVISAVAFCLMGVAIEYAQDWGGERFFDVADMAANTLGVLLGWWLTRGWFAGFLLWLDRGISQILVHELR